MVPIEVDDLLVAAGATYMTEFRELLPKRFVSGKFVEPRTSFTFAGRTLEIRNDHIGVHFEKYIKEELRPVAVEKGRMSLNTEFITESERTALRSTVYQLAWLGKEGCPTVAGTVSLLAGRLELSTVEDIAIANACIFQRLCRSWKRVWTVITRGARPMPSRKANSQWGTSQDFTQLMTVEQDHEKSSIDFGRRSGDLQRVAGKGRIRPSYVARHHLQRRGCQKMDSKSLRFRSSGFGNWRDEEPR